MGQVQVADQSVYADGGPETCRAGDRERLPERAAWPTYYDAESAARVAGMYARDFEILGYPTDFDALRVMA